MPKLGKGKRAGRGWCGSVGWRATLYPKDGLWLPLRKRQWKHQCFHAGGFSHIENVLFFKLGHGYTRILLLLLKCTNLL